MARRSAAALLAALVLLVSAVVLMPRAAAEADPAVAGFAGCLLSEKRGDLVLLFDQSDSVSANDPDDARITAARNLVRQLAGWTGDREVDLQLSVAGFAADYAESSAGWVPVRDGDAVERLDAAIEEIAVEDGFETDYWNGLQGARAALADQVGAEQAHRCQALVWFSDGAFALNPRTSASQIEQYGEVKRYASGIALRDEGATAQVQKIGMDDLCRSGGPANQLRAADVTIFGIGLSGEKTGENSFRLMRRITDNVSGDCGSLQKPPGRFWPVSSVDELISAFDQVLHGGQQLREFVLDQALTRVHILGTGAEGLNYALVNPEGEELALPYANEQQEQSTASRPGVTVRWTWLSPGSVVVDLERTPEQDWAGLWQVKITDQNADSSGDDPLVSFTGDLFPSWPADNAPLLVSGEEPAVQLGLTHADGQPFPVDQVPGEINLSAVLVDARGGEHTIVSSVQKEQLSEPVTVDLSDAAVGQGTVELSLVYTTAPADGRSTILDAQELPVAVRVLPPPDRGEVTGVLDYGVIDDVADQEASFTVTGPSCVWISGEATTVSNPADVTATLTSPYSSGDQCLQVEKGDSADFPVHLRTNMAGNGGLNGTVPVSLAPPGEPEKAVAVDVPYRADLRKPIDVGLAAGVFILALLLGIGLPLAMLYLLKWFTARIPNRALEAIRVPVTLSGGQVLAQGQPLTMESAPRASPVTLGRGRRLADAAGVALHTRMGGNPFTPSWVAATLPGHLGASSTSDAPRGNSGAAALPMGVHNTWAVFHDPTGPADRAELLLLRGLDITDADRRSLLDEARRGLPDRLTRLRAAAPNATVPAGPTDSGGWGSGSFSPPPSGPPPSGPPPSNWSASGWQGPTGDWSSNVTAPSSAPGWAPVGQSSEYVGYGSTPGSAEPPTFPPGGFVSTGSAPDEPWRAGPPPTPPWSGQPSSDTAIDPSSAKGPTDSRFSAYEPPGSGSPAPGPSTPGSGTGQPAPGSGAPAGRDRPRSAGGADSEPTIDWSRGGFGSDQPPPWGGQSTPPDPYPPA